MYDIIIIGGGPAGITAGIYAARKKLNCLILTKDFLGQIAKTAEIDNWPGSPSISGVALMQNFEKHLKNFDIEIRESTQVVSVQKKDDIFFVKTGQGDIFESKTAIVCSGALPRTLGVKGEKEFAGRGVSFCPTCDAPFFRNKAVAVVGSGNSGLEAAIDLAKYASSVVVLEKEAKPRGDELLREAVLKTGKVKFLFRTEIKAIKGNKWVEKILCESRPRALALAVQGVFIQAGFASASALVKGLVDLNERGEIKVNPVSLESSVKGLFGAGDANSLPYKQFVIAAGQGAIAALSAYRFLN